MYDESRNPSDRSAQAREDNIHDWSPAVRARHEVKLTHSLKKISPPDLLGARAQRSDGFSSL